MNGLQNLSARIMAGSEPGAERPFTDPLIAAVMRSGTMMANDRGAQRAAKDAVDRLAAQRPIEIRTKIDPVTGEQTNSYKNIPAGSDADLAIASRATGSLPDSEAAPQSPQSVALADYIASLPRSSTSGGVSPFEGVGRYRGGYRAARELGADPLEAALSGLAVKFGLLNRADVERDVNRDRDLAIARTEELSAPIRREEKLALDEAANERRYVSQVINGSDMSWVQTPADREAAYAKVANELGVKTLTDSTKAQIDRKTLRDVRSRQDARLASFMKDKALGGYATKDQLLASYGQGLRRDQQDQLENEYNMQRAEYLKKEKRDQFRDDLIQKQNELENLRIQKEAEAQSQARALALLNTPEAAASYVDRVKQDPDAWKALPEKTPEQRIFKARIEQGLRAQGLRPPSDLTTGEKTQLDAAMIGRNTLEEMRSIVNDIRSRYNVDVTGPVAGLINEYETKGLPLGALRRAVYGQNLTTAQLQELRDKLTQLATKSNYLVTMEARATTGSSRMAYEMMRNFERVSANEKRPGPIIDAQLKAMGDHMDNVASSITARRWGGKVPAQTPAAGANDPMNIRQFLPH